MLRDNPSIGRFGKGSGRPRKIADPARVVSLFAQGLTLIEVAKVLDMGRTALRQQIQANPVLADAINDAHVKMLAEMGESLRARALSGHAPSMRMLLERLDASRV